MMWHKYGTWYKYISAAGLKETFYNNLGWAVILLCTLAAIADIRNNPFSSNDWLMWSAGLFAIAGYGAIVATVFRTIQEFEQTETEY